MIRKLINAYKKHMIYRATYNELARLTEKELYDLGIDRSQIEKVALEATYGSEEKIEFNFFKDLFKVKTEKDRINEYLSDAVNTVDLENRLRNVDRGLAPWQIRARNFSQNGWVS
jgi:uncharacterized protein YjiS (DUF1127 family)